MSVFSWVRDKVSRTPQGNPGSPEPGAQEPGAQEPGAQEAGAQDSGGAESSASAVPAEQAAPAAGPEPAAESDGGPAPADTIKNAADTVEPEMTAADGADIPRQQSTAEAADTEAGESART
ncbi:hypothetical protein [Streptomyces sparsus]